MTRADTPLNLARNRYRSAADQDPRIFQRIARTVADLATTIHGPPSVVLVPAARRDELEIAARVPNQKLDGHTAALER